MTYRNLHGQFVSKFVSKLSGRSQSDTVENPYLREFPRQNIEAYLKILERRSEPIVMIVGEAPGHRGCAITGIPFTSGALLRSPIHPILEELGSQTQSERVESDERSQVI
jgi:hypothetical protein